MLVVRQRGDTVIELVLAFAIFSFAAITTIAILNQGVAIAGRSLEKGLVRQQIDAQAELLRYIKDTKDPLWGTITTAHSVAAPMALSPSTCPTVSELGDKSFFVAQDSAGNFTVNTLSAASGNYASAQTYARIDYSVASPRAYGVWLQAVKAENRSSDAGLDAYDFYIHACWNTIGSSQPSTVGTIVRLYEK
jgi:hypothetical protein